MKVSIKYKTDTATFDDEASIVFGGNENCDFTIDALGDAVVKMIFSSKYNKYVLINSVGEKALLLNGKPFSKVLVSKSFELSSKFLGAPIEILIAEKDEISESVDMEIKTVKDSTDTFDNDIEKKRIAIIKEIGFSLLQLKGNIKTSEIISFILNVAVLVLSIVSSFGITNYLLGFKIDNSSSVLNLTTNVGFLACASAIVVAVCLILKQGIYSLLEINATKRLGVSDIAPKAIVGISSIFLFVVYIMNLFYYKSVPGFGPASFFVAILFVGALATVTVAGGYFKFQIQKDKQSLQSCEYREDFETLMKSYRKMIVRFINKLSVNRINTIKSNLLNKQLQAIMEVFIGLLTAPFLAYGVSNTLASCFPEAANWQRISGLRFSPIFLVLATFLIIFAFFSFVRAFTIGKQIKGSEIIKFDGFHDYDSHGVNVFGLDSMRSLEKEKNVVMFIACFIILIEFTMNVSYFITEIGGDIQGMFLSVVTALVPTALLIAETHMLSASTYKINIYEELLSKLD
jgi:hypothetical protein